jgi:hypothetical protein
MIECPGAEPPREISAEPVSMAIGIAALVGVTIEAGSAAALIGGAIVALGGSYCASIASSRTKERNDVGL